METSSVKSHRRLTVRIAGAAFAIIAAVMAGLAMHLVRSYRTARDMSAEQLRLVQLVGQITHLDEVLTMSARMAAVTGDPEWERRYLLFEPQLAAEITEARDVARTYGGEPDASATDAANTQLVAMETRAFDLVRAGRLEEARQALFSPAYEEQKRIYAAGMEQVTRALDGRREQLLAGEKSRLWSSLVAILMASALLVGASLLVLGTLRKWETQLLLSRQELLDQTDALQVMNQRLDRKVAERTTDLSTLNVQLQQEVASRRKTEQELAHKVEQLETLNNILMGREERVMEMKQEVNSLLAELGRARRYEIEPRPGA